MRCFCTEYAIVGLPVVSQSDGLQSYKRYFFAELSIQLSISRSLAYWTVNKYPRDAALSMKMSVHQSTIIQGMCSFCAEYTVIGLPVVSLLDGLQ